ncbi:hypothetical protein [Streptomyces sp. NPDC058644]
MPHEPLGFWWTERQGVFSSPSRAFLGVLLSAWSSALAGGLLSFGSGPPA